jgi:hypothetical protein
VDSGQWTVERKGFEPGFAGLKKDLQDFVTMILICIVVNQTPGALHLGINQLSWNVILRMKIYHPEVHCTCGSSGQWTSGLVDSGKSKGKLVHCT